MNIKSIEAPASSIYRHSVTLFNATVQKFLALYYWASQCGDEQTGFSSNALMI